jgi:hypothetical protein
MKCVRLERHKKYIYILVEKPEGKIQLGKHRNR